MRGAQRLNFKGKVVAAPGGDDYPAVEGVYDAAFESRLVFGADCHDKGDAAFVAGVGEGAVALRDVPPCSIGEGIVDGVFCPGSLRIADELCLLQVERDAARICPDKSARAQLYAAEVARDDDGGLHEFFGFEHFEHGRLPPMQRCKNRAMGLA